MWLLPAVLLMAGCGHAPIDEGVAKSPLPVEILVDAKGCPTATRPESIEISKDKGQGILWKVAALGEKGEQPVEFSVYFDPFVGGSRNRQSKNGQLRSPPLDSATPVNVQFKYTIVTDRCDEQPLDPVITVRH